MTLEYAERCETITVPWEATAEQLAFIGALVEQYRRAALRERDAALAYELEAEAVDIKSRHACPLLAIGVAQACGPCSEAAALYRKASSIRRALLEEAGK